MDGQLVRLPLESSSKEPFMTRNLFGAVLVVFGILLAGPSQAQTPAPGDDASLVLADPDYTIVSLPTSLRLPPMKGAFRVTHRFIRPLDCELCPDNFWESLFGMDSGAQIGLEYRMGLIEN